MKTKLLTIFLALLLAGCVKFAHTDSQGNVTEYLRIGPQSIRDGSVTLPDGSVLNFKEQKAELPKVKITTTSIIIGREKVGHE